MTIFLRALYGPFGPDTNQSEEWDWSTGQPVLRYRGPVSAIDWHFFGIRENDTVGRWTLRFDLKSRRWKAFAAPVNDEVKVGGGWRKAILDPAFKDAFVPDEPMVYGPTYLAILKLRLRKEDIALSSRLALEAARR